MEVSGDREAASVWRARVSAWRSSGLSRREYCTAQGLSPKTFGWWAWRLSRPESEAGRFVAVTVAPEPVEAIADASATSDRTPVGRSEPGVMMDGIEIALPDGVLVRVGTRVDGVALRRVLTALGR